AVVAGPVAAAEPLVTKVLIEGNVRVEDDAIRVNLETRAGSPLDPARIDRDVRAIYAMGFFDQVSVERREDEGRVVLVFRVDERPLVRKVEIEGTDKVKREDVEGALRVRPHTIFDPGKAHEGILAARKLYAEKGYLDATIDLTTTPTGENEVDLKYAIDEKKPIRVQKIRIEGNRAFSDRKLRGLMQTKTAWILTPITGAGNLNRDVLRADGERLTAWYYDHGYVTVRVDEPQVERKGDGLVVTVKIEEGEQFRVASVDLEGEDLPPDPRPLLAGLETKAGEVFSASGVRDDTQELVTRLSDDGYAFAKVEPVTNVDVEQKTIDVRFQVDRGEPVTVDRIQVAGNTKTRDKVIRRELRLQEQELFSGTKLRKSRDALQRLGFFREVNIGTRRTDREDRLDLVVDVKEAQTGAVSAGAGFSSADALLFNLQINENNLFGRGQRLVLNIDVGSIRRNIVLSFTEPYFRGTPLTVGVDAFNWRLEFEGFDREGTGASIAGTYPVVGFGWDEILGLSMEEVRVGLGYRLEQATIDELTSEATPSIEAEEGTSTISSITPRIMRNTLNHAFDPTAGSVQDLSLEIAGLGGDRFIKAEVNNRFYYTFLRSKRFGDFTYSLGTTAGWGVGEGGLDGDDLPLFERYFPGGINSIRGFEARTLGPREAKRNRFGTVEFTTPIGGSVLLVANNEIIFPIVKGLGLKGVLFVDAGNAYKGLDALSYDATRFAAGGGVRWLSPLGPLRIELGFPFNDKPEDETSLVLFSFGGPFQF
ncbi:MAG TPA: outer membrane protein assembly factor BamA, partial [Candidatus Limnocylindria bacterium]|nr:outer membrane protein assembly factor BamA [Candidatus Limnocylindria bacterium]